MDFWRHDFSPKEKERLIAYEVSGWFIAVLSCFFSVFFFSFFVFVFDPAAVLFLFLQGFLRKCLLYLLIILLNIYIPHIKCCISLFTFLFQGIRLDDNFIGSLLVEKGTTIRCLNQLSALGVRSVSSLVAAIQNGFFVSLPGFDFSLLDRCKSVLVRSFFLILR